MAKQTINNSESGLSVRTKLNNMFTEVYNYLTGTTFPITPSSAPLNDYQVANKKYVDDNAGGGGITHYATVAAAEAGTGHSDNDQCYVEETETFYRYEAAGSALTDDNTFVLSTADAGNTRWKGVAGKYVYETVNRKSVVMVLSRTARNIPLEITENHTVVADDYGKTIKANSSSNITATLGTGTDEARLKFKIIGTGNLILSGQISDDEDIVSQLTGSQRYGSISLEYDSTVSAWIVENGSGAWDR